MSNEERVNLAPAHGDDVATGESVSVVRVKIVAPTDLPPHYPLLVTTEDGESFDVMTPDQGVYQGQEFEASRFHKPVQGHFSDDLCGCCSACCGEGWYFWLSWCCIGVAIGSIMEKLSLTWCADYRLMMPKNTFKTVCWLWFLLVAISFIDNLVRGVKGGVSFKPGEFAPATESMTGAGGIVYQVFGLVGFALGLYFFVIQIKTRMAFRQRYKIYGSCCCDCLATWFCACCSALQMYRHMKRSGETPPHFNDSIPATLIAGKASTIEQPQATKNLSELV